MAKSAKRIKSIKSTRVSGGCRKIKMKTKRSAAKRYKVLGSGKVKVPHAYRGHNTGYRSASRMNRLSKAQVASPAMSKLIRRCLPNDL